MAFNHKLFNALHPRKVPPKRRSRLFLVIGYYDDGSRWADSGIFATAEQAEQDLPPEGVTVAGVVTLNEHRQMEVVL